LAALDDVIVGDDIAIGRDCKATSRSCFTDFVVLGFCLTDYGWLSYIGIFEQIVFPDTFYDGSSSISESALAIAFIV
jgi:hypothetical protein